MRLLLLSVLVLALAVSACSPKPKESPRPEPKVKPPAVSEAGVLSVGIDLDYPPFGGVDKGKQAGIDVDVARALAADLGLDLRVVSVVPSEAASALASGSVDAVFSVSITSATVTTMTIAGSYIADGPAFFTTADDTMTVDAIGDRAVGAQSGSPAFWALREALGDDVVQVYPTLREAFGVLADGKLAVVAGDALVGAYIARDFPKIRYAGQFGAARALAVAVAKDNTTLAVAVRDSLDELAANGTLATVRRTWVGDLPELELPRE